MKKNDPLHEVIQSLSMSEKRYFKLFAQRHILGEEVKYVELFDLIDQQGEYDEEALLEKMKSKRLKGRHLSADKNHLYALLLRSLSSFHSSRTVSLKITEIIHQVDILYEKSLYDQCIRLIRKGKKNALKYDLYPLYIELATWEQKVLVQQGKGQKVSEVLTDTQQKLAKLDNRNAFMQLYYEMYKLSQRIPIARTEEEMEELTTFISHPFLKKESVAMSFQAQLQYWKIYSLYYEVRGEEEKEFQTYSRLLSLMDSQERYAQEFPFDYVSAFSRILSLKRYAPDEEFDVILAAVRIFPEKLKKVRRNVDLKIAAETYENLIKRNVYYGRLENALDQLDEQEQFFDKYQSQFSPGEVLEFQYLFAYIYLLNGLHKPALKIINGLLNEGDDSLRPDIQSFIRILNLVIHYELGNFSVMKYAADRAYRFMKRKRLLHSTERNILRLFQRLVKTDGMGIREVKSLQRDYLKQFEEVFQDPYERGVLEYFDVLSWLEAKIRNLSFKEIRIQRLAKPPF